MKGFTSLLFVGALAACGGEDPGATGQPGTVGPSSTVDNVAACKKWIDSVKCGSIDVSQMVSCDLYKNTACDISGYFSCLSTKYVCKNGQYDLTKLATVGDCASKATCK